MSVAKGSINRANNIRKKPLSNEKTEEVAEVKAQQPLESENTLSVDQKAMEKTLPVQVTQELPYYLL